MTTSITAYTFNSSTTQLTPVNVRVPLPASKKNDLAENENSLQPSKKSPVIFSRVSDEEMTTAVESKRFAPRGDQFGASRHAVQQYEATAQAEQRETLSQLFAVDVYV